MIADRVAYRAVKKPCGLLEYRQPNTAVQIVVAVLGRPMVAQTGSNRSLLIQTYDIHRMVRNSGQAMRINSGLQYRVHARTERADTSRSETAGIGEIGIIDAVLLDIRVVGLETQAIPQSWQFAEECLVGDLSAAQIATLLLVKRPGYADYLSGPVVRECPIKLPIAKTVRQRLVEHIQGYRAACACVALK